MEQKDLRISFLGDIMCTIPMTQRAEVKGGYDFKPVFENIKKTLSLSDYVVGNLETPLAGGDCLYTFHPTEFNTPDEFAENAHSAGIDLFTTANNHSLDRGVYGLKRTLNVLNKIGADSVGTRNAIDQDRTFYKNIGGLKCAFISYTYDTNSPWMNNKLMEKDLFHINLFKEQCIFPYGGMGTKGSAIRSFLRDMTPEIIKRCVRDESKLDCADVNDAGSLQNERYENVLYNDIRDAKHKSDAVFVCLHIGGQYNDIIGEYTEKIIAKCRDAGARYIICNHPHCVLPIKYCSNGDVTAYALGNFCYTPNWGYYIHGKNSEYSIALHLIFSSDTKTLVDIRFSVFISIETNVNTQVYNVYDLYKTTKDAQLKTKLKKDLKKVLFRLFTKNYSNIQIKNEYSINEFWRN